MIRIVDYDTCMIVYYHSDGFDDVVAEIHCNKLSNEKAYEIANIIKKEIEER